MELNDIKAKEQNDQKAAEHFTEVQAKENRYRDNNAALEKEENQVQGIINLIQR